MRTEDVKSALNQYDVNMKCLGEMHCFFVLLAVLRETDKQVNISERRWRSLGLCYSAPCSSVDAQRAACSLQVFDSSQV